MSVNPKAKPNASLQVSRDCVSFINSLSFQVVATRAATPELTSTLGARNKGFNQQIADVITQLHQS
jgi:hypothetical protein